MRNEELLREVINQAGGEADITSGSLSDKGCIKAGGLFVNNKSELEHEKALFSRSLSGYEEFSDEVPELVFGEGHLPDDDYIDTENYMVMGW